MGTWHIKIRDAAILLLMPLSFFLTVFVGDGGFGSAAGPVHFYSVAYFTPFL